MVLKAVVSCWAAISVLVLLGILKMASVSVSLISDAFCIPRDFFLLHEGTNEFALLAPAGFYDSTLFHRRSIASLNAWQDRAVLRLIN